MLIVGTFSLGEFEVSILVNNRSQNISKVGGTSSRHTP